MKRYITYLMHHLAMPTLVITLTLTGIVWLTQSLRFIEMIVNRGLDVATFLYLSALLIPSLLGIILPVALLCSVIYIYNKLTYESEIIVLKSSGLSKVDIAKPAIYVASILVILGYILSLYILPASYREFKETQTFIRDNYASLLLEEGVFSSPAKGLTVYIDERKKDGLLKGILVHDARETDKPTTMMAEKGVLIQTPNGPRFNLFNGNRQQIDHSNNQLSLLHFDSYTMDLSIYTEQGAARSREAEERFLGELFYPEDNISEKNRTKFLAEGHHRLVWPLYSLVLSMVGVSILLAGSFNRRGQWKRIIAATLSAIGLVVLHISSKNLIMSSPALSPVMYILAFAAMLIPLYALSTHRSEFKVLLKKLHLVRS